MYYKTLSNDIWLAGLARTLNMKLTRIQGEAIRQIAGYCDEYGVTDPRQVAYILATAYHECRFRSIREIRAPVGSAVWKMQNRYWHTGFMGRGLPQLTWEKNYRKFSSLVGLNLVKDPDAVLRPEVGAEILVYGMQNGLFSGVGLSKYFPADGSPAKWIGARRIVNGTYQADLVAAAAKKILPLLQNVPA